MNVKRKDTRGPESRIIFDNFRQSFEEEFLQTTTSEAQIDVERNVGALYEKFFRRIEVDPDCPELYRDHHLQYLKSSLMQLPYTCQGLDCSRMWLCYWLTHSLTILNCKIEDHIQSSIIDFLSRCQSKTGGFGGGPGQLPHLAPTYAAINTLCTLGTQKALEAINRLTLKEFLWSIRVGDGSFYMHIDGEIDIRGVYCALVVAKLTNIFTEALFENTAEWVARCQTYEGGFSSIPGMEAHGGYSFCGIASLHLLSCPEICDNKSLLRWTANRQMSYEGGFQGRTNKLVDGCYSFWQGGTMALLYMILLKEDSAMMRDSWLFNHQALQEYILICSQQKEGGFSDKPKVPRDPYHTCYTLSGLSIAQHLPSGNNEVVGPHDNLVEPINPIYNLGVESLRKSKHFFSQLKVV